MTEGRVPQVGEDVMYWDDDGDPVVTVLDSVGDMNAETGNFAATADGGDMNIYWSDADDMWIDADTEPLEE